MNCNIALKTIIIIIFLNVFISTSFGSVKFFQTSTVKGNSSISITFTYSANESEVKKGNNLIGNLPFTAELVKEYFSIPSGEIKKTSIYKDPKDANIINVSIDLIVKDINKISNAKALNGLKTGYIKSDTGYVLSWLIQPSFMQTNFVDTYQFLLSVDGDIRSTNGVLKNNVCNWFVFKDKMNPNGAYFLSTLNPDPSKVVKDEELTKSNPGGGEEKSCGLFGLELPFILLTGLVLSGKLKKIKK
jgi:hypothetical protein